MSDGSSFSVPDSSLYKLFQPATTKGLSRLIELIVFLRAGPISLTTLINLLDDINEDVEPFERDYSTFIERYCPHVTFVTKNRTIKCKYIEE